MLAFLTNFSLKEILVVLVMAVLIFGRRLPEVAAKAAVQLQRLRRGLQEFRRESGFDDEMRRARRMIENPIKGALEEAEREPASWRPPSPRVEPHPAAFKPEEQLSAESPADAKDDGTEASQEPTNGSTEALAHDESEETQVRPPGIIREDEPEAHS